MSLKLAHFLLLELIFFCKIILIRSLSYISTLRLCVEKMRYETSKPFLQKSSDSDCLK